MKKIYIIMAVLATAVIVSCEQEKSFIEETLGKNALVLSMQGAPSTRSMESGAFVEKGEMIELGMDENGNAFVMEETIQDLNASWAPATKGTPAFSENVGVLYEKMGVHAGSGNYEFYSMDNSEGTATGSMTGKGWRYQGEFTWGADSYDFYFWMPTTGNGITGTPTYGKTGNDLSISFSYTSPNTAKGQKDLIFAARNITKAQAADNRVNGVPVLFNHVLTGVKFAIENYDAEKQITIKSVSFNKLYDSGTCTVKPATEDNYQNQVTNNNPTYSSSDEGRVVWTLGSARGTSPITSEGFGAPVDFTANGSFDKNGKYPSSFSAAGNEDNLNDKDASQTFWLIPQAMSNDVTLTIVYTFGSSEEQTWTIDFGKVLAAKKVVWKAGELRTYTIKLDDVNVKIEDSVTNTLKNNIVITNTGNTAAFIRASIVGQWLDSKGRPVFGFTDLLYNFYAVDSWYQDQFVKTTAGTHGTFTGLPGYKGGTNPLNGWYLCTDGYYYYSNPVEPTKATGYQDGENYVQQNLFTQYSVGTPPAVQISGVDTAIHFSLEIATQAVSAKKLDGSTYTWQEAWANATGTTPTVKQ